MANEEKRERDTGISKHPNPEKDTKNNPKEVPMKDPEKERARDTNSEPTKRIRR